MFLVKRIIGIISAKNSKKNTLKLVIRGRL